MQPLSGNQHPDLLTSLVNMSLVPRLPREMHLSRSSSNVPRLPSFLKLPQNPHVLLTFEKVHNPHRLPRKTRAERPKVLRTPQFFALLTAKCASRHNGVHFFDIATSKSATCKCASRRNGVHFFDIATSKSGLTLVCFVQFELEMCFAPQPAWIFSTSQLLKVPLANVLRATTAYTFLPSQLLKVLRTSGAFAFFTRKCASRHNGVHFFDVATSKSGPTLVWLVHFELEMCFWPQRCAIFHLSSGQLALHPPL